MIVLSESSADVVSSFGRQLLYGDHERPDTFEDAARFVVQNIFDNFLDSSNERLFGLVRIFRFGPFADLHPDLQSLAASDDEYWLSLMASMGVEPDWRDRHHSKGHRVIPADSPVTPMLQAAFSNIGLSFGKEIEAGGGGMEMHAHDRVGYLKHFHVPIALDSPYIPDQENFVVPYDIQSVVGIGSPFRDNIAYILLGFSLTPIDGEGAVNFAELNPFVGTLLASYDRDQIWSH